MSQQDKQMDKDLEEVLVRAGPRITPPDDMRARVYEATHSAWSDIPGEQGEQSAPASPNRWRPLSLALAASMLIGVRAHDRYAQPTNHSGSHCSRDL